MLLDDGQRTELAPDSETGLMQRVVSGGITNIVLYYPAEITIGE